MTTAADIVGSALRKIGSVDPDEPIDAGDYESCIAAMNRMVMRWEAKGISVGWSPVFNPDDIIPAPIDAEDALIYNLAIMIAPEYGSSPSQLVTAMAMATMAELKSSLYVTRRLVVNTDMPSSGNGPRWNMYTDGPTR